MRYNNHTVLLQKGMKESIYVVDGEKYTKFGTTTPEAVSNTLNIKELVLNGNKESLNFWDQMDYPFLLDKTAVELFRFIIDSGENDKVSNVLKRMVSDRQTISKNINVTQGEINILDLDIERYKEELHNAEEKVEAANKLIGLNQKVARFKLLKKIKEELDNIKEQQGTINYSFNKISTQLSLIKTKYSDIYNIQDRKEFLSNIFVKLNNIIGDMSDINKDIKALELYKTIEIKTDINKIMEIKKIQNQIFLIYLNRQNIKMPKLTETNINFDLFNKIVDLKGYANRHFINDSKQVDIETNKIMFKSSVELYTNLLDSFDICPFCGNKMHK